MLRSVARLDVIKNVGVAVPIMATLSLVSQMAGVQSGFNLLSGWGISGNIVGILVFVVCAVPAYEVVKVSGDRRAGILVSSVAALLTALLYGAVLTILATAPISAAIKGLFFTEANQPTVPSWIVLVVGYVLIGMCAGVLASFAAIRNRDRRSNQ
jgi:hypothetical protein